MHVVRHPSRHGRSFGQVESLEARELLAFDPSPMEQAYMESINRMRMDPQGELNVIFSSLDPLTARDPYVQGALNFFRVDRNLLLQQWSSLTPVAPVAWNERLTLAAAGHNDQMRIYDDQQHQLPGEPALGDRVRAHGYQFARVTENIFAFAENVMHGHAGFVVDWGEGPGGIQSPAGHRDNYMDPAVIEVGIHVMSESNPSTQVGPYLVTQNFGRPRSVGNPFVLGVAWTDSNANGIYDAGEGIGNATVQVVGSGGTFQTTTMSAGGYQIQVPAGTYQVHVSGGSLGTTYTVTDLTVGTQNVKADVETGRANERPTANPDVVNVSTGGFFTMNVWANDVDRDGQIVRNSVTITTTPAFGQVTVNPVNGVVTYYPTGGSPTQDSFQYTVRDNEGAISNTARVTINFSNSNTSPTADNLEVSTNEDTPLTIDLQSAVRDPENALDWQSVVIVTNPAQGSVQWNATARSFLFTPAANASGSVPFAYRISDQAGATSNSATVTVSVTPQNDEPVATADQLVVSRGASTLLAVLANDSDVDHPVSALRIEITEAPLRGTASVQGSQVRYVASGDVPGEDSFRYRVVDPLGSASAPARVNLLVVDPAKSWQNPINSRDVDWNTTISPLDALLVINHIGVELDGAGRPASLAAGPPPFVDVNGDNIVSPLDALLVINQLGSAAPQGIAIQAEDPPLWDRPLAAIGGEEMGLRRDDAVGGQTLRPTEERVIILPFGPSHGASSPQDDRESFRKKTIHWIDEIVDSNR